MTATAAAVSSRCDAFDCSGVVGVVAAGLEAVGEAVVQPRSLYFVG